MEAVGRLVYGRCWEADMEAVGRLIHGSSQKTDAWKFGEESWRKSI
jgi:hypothetical protein